MTYTAGFRIYLSIPSIQRAFDQDPDSELELVKMLSQLNNDTDGHRLYFWLHSPRPTRFITSLRQNMPDASVEPLDLVEEGALISMTTSSPSMVDSLARDEITIHEATGCREGWSLTVSADKLQHLAELHRDLEQDGFSTEIVRFQNDETESIKPESPSLTALQEETLQRAYEGGYYEDPRRITQEGLAEEFGVSPRAISKRLRAGTKKIVESAVIVHILPAFILKFIRQR